MSSKIAYTLCSANHLAYAKTMADSFILYNPDYKVFIGLVDKINNRFDESFFLPHTLIEVDKLEIEPLQEMSDKYTILELNCAVKPFMAQYLFKHYNPDVLIYTDTDILYYSSIQPIEDELQEADILLSPHLTKPLNDGKIPNEREFLRAGLFNAGFFVMKKSETTNAFLMWWGERLQYEGFLKLSEGYGADQNWLNLVFLFFENVAVIKSKGANVAYWNLHERNVALVDNKLVVNGTEPLVFLHISGYDFNNPDNISKHQTRYNLSDFPLLKNLFFEYIKKVKQNNHDAFSKMNCYYAKSPKKPTGIMAFTNKIIAPLGIKITGR